MSVDAFIRRLANVALPEVFNPWGQICDVHDRSTADAIRRRNLRRVLTEFRLQGCKNMWFGRDLGHRGGRRTGIALTDEAHLPLLGQRLGIVLEKATTTESVAERTATEVWLAISRHSETPLLWNAFPFHPHRPGDPASNRQHRRAEAAAVSHITLELLDLMAPAQVIAIGSDAAELLSRLGVTSIAVRHPSYGGQAIFHAGIRESCSRARAR